MNLFTKSLAVVSALFLLAACDSPSTTSSSGQGSPNSVSGGPVRPGSPEDLAQNVGDRVFFETDSSDLTSKAQDTLDKQARWLQQYARYSFTVEGHADERGVGAGEGFNHNIPLARGTSFEVWRAALASARAMSGSSGRSASARA